MMATLSYPENTAKSSFHHYKSFPGIFKPAQPLTCFRKLMSSPNCTVSVLNIFIYIHARKHLCANTDMKQQSCLALGS